MSTPPFEFQNPSSSWQQELILAGELQTVLFPYLQAPVEHPKATIPMYNEVRKLELVQADARILHLGACRIAVPEETRLTPSETVSNVKENLKEGISK